MSSPTHIGRYELLRGIGAGAMGKVLLAADPKLGRQVAIKVLADHADAEVQERFRREARAIAALKHPNIVALYDYSGEDAEQLFLVMEYVPGPTLSQLTLAHGPMSETTALCVGHDLALALEHAHSQGVVHRDIKPENIILHDGRVVLTDFGAVKAVARANPTGAPRQGGRTRAIGTPGYMAPEQFDGQGVGVRTDLFGLGATLYNLTTGRIPYEGGSIDATYQNLKAGRYVDPRSDRPLLSAPFCELLARCLAPKSAKRAPDAGTVRREIRALLEAGGVGEIRDELARYQEGPARATIQQRERAVDQLIKELKVALKDRDGRQARILAARVQQLAPVDERLQDISGIDVGRGKVRRPVRLAAPQRWPWLAAGLLLGFAAGVTLGRWLPAIGG